LLADRTQGDRCRAPSGRWHGARDELIAPSEATSALAAAGTAAADKALVLVPRRGHNDLSGEDSYWRALAGFVARSPA